MSRKTDTSGPLTVARLIAKLQTLPPHAIVEVMGLYASSAEIEDEKAVYFDDTGGPRRRQEDRKPRVIISTDLCTG